MKNTIFEIILTIIPLIVTAITILIWYLKGYDEKLKTHITDESSESFLSSENWVLAKIKPKDEDDGKQFTL